MKQRPSEICFSKAAASLKRGRRKHGVWFFSRGVYEICIDSFVKEFMVIR